MRYCIVHEYQYSIVVVFSTAMAQVHNSARLDVGVNPLEWDDELAAEAQVTAWPTFSYCYYNYDYY